MPFSKYLDVIRPILELYDNCDYEGAAILSRRELGEADEKPLKVLLQTLLYHFEGHSRWESSYDYASARNLLTKAGDGLICGACKLKYPIKDGIPVMLIDEAIPTEENSA